MSVPSYDVAISFCGGHLRHAKQLTEILRERCKVFIYTENQQEMFGTNGEVFLRRVFLQQSKIVVILHGLGWGKTDWTYIEERAIQDRARENKSHDFILLVRVEVDADLPAWFPSSQIRCDLRDGIQKIAAAILSKINGPVEGEILREKIARIGREKKTASDRKIFLGSHQGAEAAAKEARLLFAEVQSLVSGAEASSLRLSCEVKDKSVMVQGAGYKLLVEWNCLYGNSLDSSSLSITLLKLNQTRSRRRDVWDDWEIKKRGRELF